MRTGQIANMWGVLKMGGGVGVRLRLCALIVAVTSFSTRWIGDKRRRPLPRGCLHRLVLLTLGGIRILMARQSIQHLLSVTSFRFLFFLRSPFPPLPSIHFPFRPVGTFPHVSPTPSQGGLINFSPPFPLTYKYALCSPPTFPHALPLPSPLLSLTTINLALLLPPFLILFCRQRKAVNLCS